MTRINSKGQALVEYVLIIALVSVLIIGLVKTFGGYLKDSIQKTSCSMIGEEYVAGARPGEGKCQEPTKEPPKS
ncbi:MAG: hypothetical protein RR047_03045 [Bacilli bacterium]